LTGDIIFAIGTTLIRIECPEEVQSSVIDSNTGERSDIISSWYRAAVKHILAKAMTIMPIEGCFEGERQC